MNENTRNLTKAEICPKCHEELLNLRSIRHGCALACPDCKMFFGPLEASEWGKIMEKKSVSVGFRHRN